MAKLSAFDLGMSDFRDGVEYYSDNPFDYDELGHDDWIAGFECAADLAEAQQLAQPTSWQLQVEGWARA